MQQLIDPRLDATFSLYEELAAILSADRLRQSLPVPSNHIGLQLWCVIGARETWTRSLASGTWGPLACSIQSFEDSHKPEVITSALQASATAYRTAAAAAPLMTPAPISSSASSNTRTRTSANSSATSSAWASNHPRVGDNASPSSGTHRVTPPALDSHSPPPIA